MNDVAVALVFVNLIVDVPGEKVIPLDPTVQPFALLRIQVLLPMTIDLVRPDVDVKLPESVKS